MSCHLRMRGIIQTIGRCMSTVPSLKATNNTCNYALPQPSCIITRHVTYNAISHPKNTDGSRDLVHLSSKSWCISSTDHDHPMHPKAHMNIHVIPQPCQTPIIQPRCHLTNTISNHPTVKYHSSHFFNQTYLIIICNIVCHHLSNFH